MEELSEEALTGRSNGGDLGRRNIKCIVSEMRIRKIQWAEKRPVCFEHSE